MALYLSSGGTFPPVLSSLSGLWPGMFLTVKWGESVFIWGSPAQGKGRRQLALRSSAAGILLDGAWGQERKASCTSGFPSACPDLNFLLNVACYESPSFCGFPTICTKSVTGECHFLRTKEGPCTRQTPGRTVLTGQLDYPHCTDEQTPAPGSQEPGSRLLAWEEAEQRFKSASDSQTRVVDDDGKENSLLEERVVLPRCSKRLSPALRRGSEALIRGETY